MGAPDEIKKAIEKYQTFLISTHIHADGDAIASELALFRLLKNLGKTAYIINDTPTPAVYQGLPDAEHIQEFDGRLPQGIEVLFIIDAPSLERLGRVGENLPDEIFIINIDHHPPLAPFAHIHWQEPSASSTGELLFRLFQENFAIDEKMAENLYVAILTDTGRFTFPNTTPESLRAAAELVRLGASPEVIGRKLYQSLSLAQLKIRSRAEDSLEKSQDGKIAWTSLTQKDFEETGLGPEDTQGLADLPRSLAGVEAGVLFRELPQNKVKVSLRSKGKVDVNEIARKFGGGGHPQAAGCILEGSLPEIQKKILRALEEAIK